MIRIVSSQYGAVFSIGSPFSISPTIYVSANKITGPPDMIGPLYLLTHKVDQIIFFKNSQKIIKKGQNIKLQSDFIACIFRDATNHGCSLSFYHLLGIQ